MSFGPKLEAMAVGEPGSEVLVTMSLDVRSAEFEYEAEVFVEEPTGLRTVTIKAVGKKATPDGKP